MAKIGTFNFRWEHIGHALSIFYTSSKGFYIKLPECFHDTIKSMKWDDVKALGVRTTFSSKHDAFLDRNPKYEIAGDHELGVKKKAETIIRTLTAAVKRVEPVILVEFKTDYVSFSLPKLGDTFTDLAINVLYANRCTIGDNKPTYEMGFGRKLNINDYYQNKVLVLPDNPEFRIKLETLVDTLKTGSAILADLFSSSDSVLSALENPTTPLLFYKPEND